MTGFSSTIAGTWQAARIVAAVVPVLRAADELGAARARRHLADVLGQLRGLPTKLGQWLGGGADGEDFAASTTTIKPLPWSAIQQELTAAWGCDPACHLAWIDEQGQAASLGQVHRAKRHDGREVAVKIRYPGIADDIDATLSALDLMPGVGPAKTYGIDLDGHRAMLRSSLDHELDYRHEAIWQQRAAQSAVPGVVVPRIHADLTNNRVLVQSWEAGSTMAEAAAWPQTDRDAAGAALVRRFIGQAVVDRLLHADPHPGNLRLRQRPTGIAIVQYDHGCMVELTTEQVLALRALVEQTRTGTSTPLSLLAAVGFDATKLTHLSPRLPAILAIILAPLTHRGAHDAVTWHPATELNTLLGADRWWFRAAGSPSFFLFTRAFAGLVRQLQQLRARVDWVAAWDQATGTSLPAHGQAIAVEPAAAPATGPSTHLRVRVTAGTDVVAEVELPATSVEALPDLLDPAVAEAVTRLGIDLDALAAGCRMNGWRPCELVATSYRRADGAARHVRVWLQ